MTRHRKEIPLFRTRLDDFAARPVRTCQHDGCGQPAEYRAPKSPRNTRDYYWFCLEHVREYNRSWNYFQGMTPEEVERYKVESVTGHRPTWRLGERGFRHWIDGEVEDPLDLLREGGVESAGAAHMAAERRLTRQQRSALAKLELDVTATLQEVKMRYKQLVKRYHPDANGGDKRAEERFKTISEAYRFLVTSGLS